MLEELSRLEHSKHFCVGLFLLHCLKPNIDLLNLLQNTPATPTHFIHIDDSCYVSECLYNVIVYVMFFIIFFHLYTYTMLQYHLSYKPNLHILYWPAPKKTTTLTLYLWVFLLRLTTINKCSKDITLHLSNIWLDLYHQHFKHITWLI